MILFRHLLPLILILIPVTNFALGQDKKSTQPMYQIKVEPSELKLKVGMTKQLKAKVIDQDGKTVKKPIRFYSLSRRSLPVSRDGKVKGLKPGKFSVMAMVFGSSRKSRIRTTISVTVEALPLDRIVFQQKRKAVYQFTTVPYSAKAFDTGKNWIKTARVDLTSNDPTVASIDEYGYLTAHKLGTVTLTAKAKDVTETLKIKVVANPVQKVVLSASKRKARTGDVVFFNAVAKDKKGKVVSDAPILYSCFALPDDNLGAAATGQITGDGRFVAEKPGQYTIVASTGKELARLTLRVTPRTIQKSIKVLGHAPVRKTHTSDLWVWTGVDGRDYAVTGTWGAKGEAHFWDVTDPTTMKKIDTIKVDARTVNDVKVSKDGKLCIISREGASNRKNGIVILDVTNPRKVKILSTFTEQLTGGVHNLFIYKDHVYALSASRRYDVINIKNPKKPKRVGTFELKTPGHAIHDVWVVDGLAYSSNWRDGVQIVDVGNGVAGGTPEKPVKIGSYAYPSGWNHAAFPFRSSSTGKFFVIAGDEAFPYGLGLKRPTIAAGWLHFIDFTDMKNPKEVARYEVPEAGTHNFWVDGETLYVAYYNGGLRVIDISGELMGDLYRQGREIAKFIPFDPKGVVANAPMVWGPQLHKGVIFFSDWNSGLWAVKVVQKKGRRKGVTRAPQPKK
ncbi:MAG: Ig-like domain-containing protein [Gemmataceae bacterium]